MQLDRNSHQQRLWNQIPETDAHRSRPRNYLEGREQNSATAFANGSRAFAKELLKRRLSPNPREASQRLIENSRRLLAQSRQLIVEAKNTLAFSRCSSTQVN